MKRPGIPVVVNLKLVILIDGEKIAPVDDRESGNASLIIACEHFVNRHVRARNGKRGQIMAGPLNQRIAHFTDGHRLQLPVLQHIGTAIQPALQMFDARLSSVLPTLRRCVPGQQAACIQRHLAPLSKVDRRRQCLLTGQRQAFLNALDQHVAEVPLRTKIACFTQGHTVQLLPCVAHLGIELSLIIVKEAFDTDGPLQRSLQRVDRLPDHRQLLTSCHTQVCLDQLAIRCRTIQRVSRQPDTCELHRHSCLIHRLQRLYTPALDLHKRSIQGLAQLHRRTAMRTAVCKAFGGLQQLPFVR